MRLPGTTLADTFQCIAWFAGEEVAVLCPRVWKPPATRILRTLDSFTIVGLIRCWNENSFMQNSGSTLMRSVLIALSSLRRLHVSKMPSGILELFGDKLTATLASSSRAYIVAKPCPSDPSQPFQTDFQLTSVSSYASSGSFNVRTFSCRPSYLRH